VLGRALGLSDEIVTRALDPRNFVTKRDILGGPAPRAVMALDARQSAQLTQDVEWWTARVDELGLAQKRLNEAMSGL